MGRTEKAWWLGVGIWVLIFVFWRPQPPPLYTEVPSSKTDPDGFRIFYELVQKHAKTVSRTLRGAAHLKDRDVLVLLRPGDGIDSKEQQELMDWVRDRGGTLVVGYPIWDGDGALLKSVFLEEAHWNLSLWEDAEAKLTEVTYVAANVEKPRTVTPFTLKIRGKMVTGEGASKPLAVAKDGAVLATWDAYGAGQIVQLADAALLGNEALGFKKSHLFAAALLDEIGRDDNWVFDESNEGVSIQPALAPLLGAGPFRAVFLHGMLLLLFWYWYQSRRHGRMRQAESERDVREVTTMAADIGRFYFGARKNHWALSRYLAFFKHRLKTANIRPEERARASATMAKAESLLEGNAASDEMLPMIRKMAEHREVFLQSHIEK